MMRAPACAARRITSALRVSMDRGTRTCFAKPSMTGSTRRHSSSMSIGSEPGRVDSPPMSRISAPSASSCSAMGDGGLGCEITAAVGKAVGRDVDDAHDTGPVERKAGDGNARLLQTLQGLRDSLISAVQQFLGRNEAAPNGPGRPLDQLRSRKQQILAARNFERCRRRRRLQASDRPNVEACRHSVLVRLSLRSPHQGCAVPIPAGPPFVLMVPTFCSDRPVRPE